MNKIAICDDNFILAGRLEDILLDLQHPFNDVFEIEAFSSGEEMINDLDGGNFYDIVFLDIEMGKTSGIDVGHHMRRVRQNQDTAIIYVSSYDHYHTKLYPVKTTAFIKKPPTVEGVREAVILALEQRQALKPDYFIYEATRRIEKVPKSDIYYFKSDRKYMTIVTKRHTDIFYMTMDMLLNSIDDPAFVQTHRSYIANVRNITTYSRTELFFPNEHSIPVSYRSSTEVKRVLLMNLK